MSLSKRILGDCFELQRGYDLTASQMEAGNILVAGSNGIIGFHNVEKSNRPCITVGRSGSVGKVHYYDMPTWAHNTTLFIKDFKGNNPRYLYYYLKNLRLDTYFGKEASVIPSLDRKKVHAIAALFEDNVDKQAKIANFLSLLDRKIALNRQINDNLEAMAKQLYDYWFVQFDFPNEDGKPYKSSGGKMVWNEKLKREIPEGWEVKTFGDTFGVKKGSLITSSSVSDGNVKVVAAGVNFSYLTGEHNRPKYTTTISGSGANAGYINFWREEIFASDCTTINGDNYIKSILGYYAVKMYQDYLFRCALGSAQPHVYPNQISDLPNICIPDNLVDKVEPFILPLHETISKNIVEIESLTKQRDELLPLLMNGQVAIAD